MPRLRRPYRWLLMCVTLGLLAFASAYVFAAASWEASRFPNATPFDFVRPRIMDMWIVTFFILVGASVGSFLNVVVWRLPRGRGVHGESECPHCKRLLRAQDNLPIIGWLLLGGRCRDCRLPISSRYLIVELLLAISFSLIGSATVFRVSLPIGVEGPDLIWDFAPRLNLTLLCVLLVHFVALSGLWAMALIRFDELSIPRSLIFFVIGALTLGFLAVPPSMVVPWQMMDAVEPRLPVAWPPSAWWRWNEGGFANEGTRAVSLLVVQTVVRIITALVAAGFIGRVLAKSLCPAADLKLDPLGKQSMALVDLIALLAVPAFVVGWQSLLGIVAAAGWLAWATSRGLLGERLRAIRDPLRRFAVCLPVALTFHLVFWRALIDTGIWPCPQAPRGVLLFWGGLVLLSPVWLRVSSGRSSATGSERPKANEQARKPTSVDED